MASSYYLAGSIECVCGKRARVTTDGTHLWADCWDCGRQHVQKLGDPIGWTEIPKEPCPRPKKFANGHILKVYIAGAYRAATENRVLHNILHARGAAAEFWQAGCAVFCPHMNSAFMGGVTEDTNFLRGDIEFLKLCDVLVVLSNSERSTGTQGEIEAALRQRLEIVEQVDQKDGRWKYQGRLYRHAVAVVHALEVI